MQKRFAGRDRALASRHATSDSKQDEKLIAWTCGQLLPEVIQGNSDLQITVYPALVDRGDHACVRVLDSLPAAQAMHRAGVRRLLMLREAKAARTLKKSVRKLQEMELHYAKVAQAQDGASDIDRSLLDELLLLAFDQAFLQDDPWTIRDVAAFEHCRERGRQGLGPALLAISQLVGDILVVAHRVRASLAEMRQPNWRASVQDMQAQLDRLVYRGFLLQTDAACLGRFPCYLQAMQVRIEKLPVAAARDGQRLQEMAALQEDWLDRQRLASQQGRFDPRLEQIRWLLEELRISLFAQELKTAEPVSVKRIRARWEALGL